MTTGNCRYLHSFDQVMVSAADDISDRDDWKIFHREMEAQFYFHCGTVILNKASEVGFEDHILTDNCCSHTYCIDFQNIVEDKKKTKIVVLRTKVLVFVHLHV